MVLHGASEEGVGQGLPPVDSLRALILPWTDGGCAGCAKHLPFMPSLQRCTYSPDTIQRPTEKKHPNKHPYSAFVEFIQTCKVLSFASSFPLHLVWKVS